MSSTHRASIIRQPDDFYATPEWCTRAILPHLNLTEDSSVLEPGCGSGAIAKVLRETYPRIWTDGVEIDEGRADKAGEWCSRVHRADFLTMDCAALGDCNTCDIAIGNPPFAFAQEFIERALLEVLEVCFLLRVNFVGSLKRTKFFREHPCDLFTLPRRPSFAKSVKCKARRKNGCAYAALLALDEPHPKQCPLCGAKVDVVTTDSIEYAWFVFGPERQNSWRVLDVEPAKRRTPKSRGLFTEAGA